METVPYTAAKITALPLSRITTRAQIRTRNGFDRESLEELAASLKRSGMLQPVTVTPADDSGMHTLVIGERRILAASLAGLEEVPAIITSGNPAQLAAAQAVENLQRVDLHPADVADGLLALYNAHGKSWRDVAAAIGKSAAWVSKRRALTRLRPLARQVMNEGFTTDPEIILGLNSLDRMKPDVAMQLAARMEAGQTVTREEVRKALQTPAAPAEPKAASDDDDDTGDDTKGSEEKPTSGAGSVEHRNALIALKRGAENYAFALVAHAQGIAPIDRCKMAHDVLNAAAKNLANIVARDDGGH